MKLINLLGIILLALPFLGMFIFMAYECGVRTAIGVFLGALSATILIAAGALLLCY